MNELKYIIFIPKGMNINGARAILFNGYITHKAIGEALEKQNCTLYSAGFIYTESGIGLKCHGRSESLNLDSKKGDAHIIETTIRGEHGMLDMLAYDGS